MTETLGPPGAAGVSSASKAGSKTGSNSGAIAGADKGADAGPIFVARETYRRRRLADAARLLPVLGLICVLMPGLWVPSNSVGATGRGVVYIFVIWALLIVLAAMISARLSGHENPEEASAQEEGGRAIEGQDLGGPHVL